MSLERLFSISICIISLSLVACEPAPMTVSETTSQGEALSGNTFLTDNNSMASISSITIETGDNEADASRSNPLKLDFDSGATLDVFWKFQSSGDSYIGIDLVTSGLESSEAFEQTENYWPMVTMPICDATGTCVDDFVECMKTAQGSIECEYQNTVTNAVHANSITFDNLPNIQSRDDFPQVYQVVFRVCSDSNLSVCDSASAGYVEIYH